MIWSGQMMLLHLGETEAAQSIMNAIDLVLGRHSNLEVTPDLGGEAKTQALGAAIEKAIMEGN
jgi:tartrate dehydrogenase/decarboxylase/D-malate dehydrogenase